MGYLLEAKTGLALYFDATLTERISDPVQVTQHVVEANAAIVDHARILPITLQVEAVVSNTPVRGLEADDGRPDMEKTVIKVRLAQPTLGLFQNVVSGVQSVLSGQPPSIPELEASIEAWGFGAEGPTQRVKGSIQMPSGQDFARNAYDQLVYWKDQVALLTWTSSKRALENLVLQTVDVQRDIQTGDGLTLSLGFVQARFAKAKTTKVKRMGKLPQKASTAPQASKATVLGAATGSTGR